MADILDRIDWDHYRRTLIKAVEPTTGKPVIVKSKPIPKPAPKPRTKHEILAHEVELVALCKLIKALDDYDSHLIMLQRCKRLSAESKQRGVDAVCW